MPIRTAIVDDEPLARRSLRSLLKSHAEFEIVAECANGREATALINSQPIDLMFLDIQMPEVDGFQVLEKLDTERVPVIIFVTAFDEFAIKAFEVSATDYLLKPVDDRRFAQALTKAQAMLKHRCAGEVEDRLMALLDARDPVVAATRPYSKRLLIRTNSRVAFLQVEDIDYIEADDYYSSIHVGTKTHLLREPIKELEVRLDPKEFVRIHRSAIVNIQRIKELRTLSSGGHAVHLLDGTVLKLSRSRWESVRLALSK
jgi:two-component system LytT family response regulator